MQYSPKLKTAMTEIKEILQKHDISGMVVLHTEGGFSEYLLKIDPSYSVVKFEGQQALRFRAKLHEDFHGNKQLMEHKLSNTANMLKHFSDIGGNLVLAVMDVSERFDKIIGANHTGGSHTSQLGLDN